MLGNLKLVLLQHRKFLVVFFTVVFLPSIILAFLGIRSIQNERYKYQQQNQEQQRELIRDLKTEVQSFVEKTSLGLKELSLDRAFIDRDYAAITELISKQHQNGTLNGNIVVWNLEETLWIPSFQARPANTEIPVIPQEWKKWSSDLERAELAEFRRKNYSDAISRYKQMLSRVNDRQVKAWIMSRVARCEIKQMNHKRAIEIYRSIITDFPDVVTESGRPLELISHLEMLNAIGLDKDFKSFFPESIELYSKMTENAWSLNEDQITIYSALLKTTINEAIAEVSSNDIPEKYTAAIADSQNSIAEKLEIWGMAEDVRQKVLSNINENSIHKNSVAYKGQDVLAFWIPVNGDFLGSLVRIGDISNTVGDLLSENIAAGISVLLRSVLTDQIIFGENAGDAVRPIISDVFPENFPPWKIEVYQLAGGGTGFLLYKNILFWTILAMLFILLVGSAFIIRSIFHEVNLLNLKSDFIASVSHEFKTPLTSMGAILEHLMESENKNPDKTKEYYRILRHDSDKLKRLVKNVLDFSKIEKGKREYTLEPIDIADLIRHEVESFQRENSASDLVVELKIGDHVPLILADAEALSQAIHNLLDNAAKFSGQEKKVSVDVFQKKELLEIAVRDYGIGIPENEQKKIFEKFYRGKQASSVSPTGTGLGLTLVKYIMSAHNGDVLVQSQPGEGSCISLVLPIIKEG